MRVTANPGRFWQCQVERGDLRTLTFEVASIGPESVVIVEAAAGNTSVGVPLSRQEALRALQGLADVLGLDEFELRQFEL